MNETQVMQKNLFFHYQTLRDQGFKLPNFSDTGFRVFSQNDEDGLLLYIFSLIEMESKLCLDVAYAGPKGANTTNLICNWGWHGLLIEGNQEGAEKSSRFFKSNLDTHIFPPLVRNAWVTAENLNELCEKNEFTGEIDLFSLDMDGVDYWVWEKLDAVSPRVVVVEYLDIPGPELSITIPYDPEFTAKPATSAKTGEPYDYFGASLMAFVNLAKRKGYRLVGVNKYGFNAFFVRNDLGQGHLPEIDPQSCFSHPKVKQGMRERWKKVSKKEWIPVD